MHCNARSRPFLDLKVTVRSNLKFNVQLVPVFPLDVFLEHPEQKYLGKASMEKNVFFRALPESPTPPLTPFGQLGPIFFGRQNSRFESHLRTKKRGLQKQPKTQLKVQYIGIFEEIDSFY